MLRLYIILPIRCWKQPNLMFVWLIVCFFFLFQFNNWQRTRCVFQDVIYQFVLIYYTIKKTKTSRPLNETLHSVNPFRFFFFFWSHWSPSDTALQQTPKANKRRHATRPRNSLPVFRDTALKGKVLSDKRMEVTWLEIYCPNRFRSCRTAVVIVSSLPWTHGYCLFCLPLLSTHRLP